MSVFDKNYVLEVQRRVHANDPALQEVVLPHRKISDNQASVLAKGLSKNDFVTRLDLSHNNIASEGIGRLATVFRTNQTIVELRLQHNQIAIAGAAMIANALEKNKTITKLNLSGNPIKDEGARELMILMRRNQTITHLDLEDVGAENNEFRFQIKQCVVRNLMANSVTSLKANEPDLRMLDFVGRGLQDMHLQTLAQALEQNTALETLDIGDNAVSGKSIKRLAKALRKNKRSALLRLSLSGNPLGDDGLTTFCDVLKLDEPIPLRTLHLRKTGVGDPGSSRLAVSMKGYRSNITSLDLAENSISTGGARQLAKLLKGSEIIQCSLLELDLSHNQLKGSGVVQLARALNSGYKHALRVLHLGWNDAGDTGAGELAEAMRSNVHLRTLALQHNAIGPLGAMRLAAAVGSGGSSSASNSTSTGTGKSSSSSSSTGATNATLAVLNLADNNIGDEGALALADALNTNSALTELHIRNNNIGLQSITAFYEAMQRRSEWKGDLLSLPRVDEQQWTPSNNTHAAWLVD